MNSSGAAPPRPSLTENYDASLELVADGSTRCFERITGATQALSGRAARALNLMTSQSNDIGRKVGRVGNDWRWRRGMRERRFSQRRFNRNEKLTALRRDLPPTGLS